MTVLRMEHVGIVVDDLPAAIEFFVELGLELCGEGTVEGEWAARRGSSSSWRKSSADARRS